MDCKQFSDLHCHPHLKPYGHSFNKGTHPRQDLWHTEHPGIWKKILNAVVGITKFSQTDLTTMSRGSVKLAFVSLYPFEKGFFINSAGNGPFSAAISELITGIGFRRIRHLQKHTDYFEDLCNEYNYFLNGLRERRIGGQVVSWSPAASWLEVEKILESNKIAVLFTIEGAHVFNTGLEKYGRPLDEAEILENIQSVKQWTYPPVFITFAHNFNNDLCGHARSLDPLEPFVDQRENLGEGFSKLGEKAISSLLDNSNGRRIYIDLKHMSLKSRKRYYELLKVHYPRKKIPIIVSHGAVTGTKYNGETTVSNETNLFYEADINFYDEELVEIAHSEGLFGIQLDSRRIASKQQLKNVSSNIFSKELVNESAIIVWNQIRHVAEILDQNSLFSWGTACIGSDFDGTINPLNGILTSQDFSPMAETLCTLSERYLNGFNSLKLHKNKEISAEEIVNRFCYLNAVNFVKKFC